VAKRLAMSKEMPCCAAAKSFPPRLQSSVKACIYSKGFTSEHHHLPHGLTFLQTIETEIDLVQLEAPAHQPVDR